MSGANPSNQPRWLVILTISTGTEVLPNHRIELLQIPADPQPVDVTIWTRHEDVGLAEPLPRETYLEVAVEAPDDEAAVAAAGAVATGLAAMISCCVNAYVPSPEPVLAYEVDPGLETPPVLAAVRTAHGDPAPAR